MENLSSRDLFIYRKFLIDMKNNLIDEELDKYLLTIMEFIELKYESDAYNNYNLEDFIQECFVFFYDSKNNNELNKEYFVNGIESIYQELNNTQKMTKKLIIDGITR